MKVAAILVCAISITYAKNVISDENDITKTCNCNPGEAPFICSQQESEGVLVAHENCNQFYKCSHGKPVALRCYGTLLYNPHIEVCDWPQQVECGDRVIPDPNDNNGNGDNGNEGGGDNDRPCNCNPEEAPSICSQQGSDGTLVAHEKCDHFYNCHNGVPVALKCSGNLLYNPHREWCDWPHEVDCGDRIIPDPNDNDNNGNGDNGNGDNGNEGGGDNGPGDIVGPCNCNPEEAPSICSQQESEGVLVAHENCNQFYKCNHGKPVAMRCYGNLLYNPHLEVCDWPQQVECGDRVIPDPNDNNGNGDNGNGDNGNEGGGDNDRPCNCNPEEAPSICSQEGSDGILVAHEKCDHFYNCHNGVPVALKCSGNLLYNPHREWCDWPHEVDCGDRIIPDPNDNDNNGNGDNGNEGGGDNDSGGDVGPCNCYPEEAPSICRLLESEGVLVAHENCNQFYKCSHGRPVAMRCYGNLLYNPHKEVCDWPQQVECGDRIIPDQI